jgi:tetratricopeptide (TPR) repeat protein
MPVAAGLALTALAAHVIVGRAIMMVPDVRKVPVDRLVANLERAAAENPLDPQRQINLARLHAMAYALKTDALPAVSSRSEEKTEIPYYPSGSVVPEAVQPAPTADNAAKAAGHLKKAIQHYDAALKLAPDNMVAVLGRGWAREQLGDTAGAIADYRLAISRSWPVDAKVKMVMPSQRFITREAIGYLIPLLDPKRDALEIRDLQDKSEQLEKRPRAITPIAIPLEDDLPLSAILDPLARVRFDADGAALDREWTWITPRAGWLVYDWDGRGEITSALQLFGSVTFWLFWSNGYDALGALDDDGNGTIAGGELRHLAIWRDANRNGRSDRGEVKPLAAHRIRSLSLDHIVVSGDDDDRLAAFAPCGAVMVDGRTRPTYDVVLQHGENGERARKLTRR